METKIIEVTNGPLNWGKFMLGKFEETEWERVSALPEALDQPLIRGRGWGTQHLLVLDLQTGEGAVFYPSKDGSARSDLNKTKIWTCPMSEPFMEWLYQQDLSDIQELPDHIDLPHAKFDVAGYRRTGHDDVI